MSTGTSMERLLLLDMINAVWFKKCNYNIQIDERLFDQFRARTCEPMQIQFKKVDILIKLLKRKEMNKNEKAFKEIIAQVQSPNTTVQVYTCNLLLTTLQSSANILSSDQSQRLSKTLL